ncbi:glutathione S-transferase family protein [Ottowia sp.]|uniref:glutathione S-transferase family protein n=1 Tax=Ottowia sp. TaxID=1898956 RepID=UPI003A86E4D6
MPQTLTLYTHPFSRGRIARWMLEETGLPYEAKLLDYGTTMKASAYTALNPMGKVPAVQQGETVVTETAPICAWLAELTPEKNLAPAPGSAERGTYYRWLFFAAGPLEAAITARSMGLLAPEDKRISAGYGSFDDVMATLEFACKQALARGGFLCGHFTAADLYLASHLNFGMQFKTIESRQVFTDYVTPALQRPAFVRAGQLDDALAEQVKAAAAQDTQG